MALLVPLTRLMRFGDKSALDQLAQNSQILRHRSPLSEIEFNWTNKGRHGRFARDVLCPCLS